MPDPGDLRHRGTIEAMTPTVDEGGGQAEAWASVATVYAHVESLGGDEQLRAMGVGVIHPHRVLLRYRPGLGEAVRFVEHHPDGDRVHNVKSVRDVDGHRAYMELLTEVTT